MSTLRRFMTLMRGQVRAGTEAVLDANALALLDQQLFDTEQALVAARRDLAALMAERNLAQQQQEKVAKDLARYEDYALSALRKDQDQLAEDTAARVVELEQEQQRLAQQITGLSQREAEFRELVREAGQTLRALRQQQVVARVSERVQKSGQRLEGGNASLQERLQASQETLQRIQSRQDRCRAQWQARQELDRDAAPGALDQRLEEAGILPGRQQQQQDVLLRLKAKLNAGT